jgi:NADH-quinone oxidoreductase subunit A
MGNLSSYLPLAATLGVAGALGLVLLGAAARLGPKSENAAKAEPFECGSDPIGNARQRFSVRFYVVGLLFIVFDLETVFLFPWALQLKALGWLGYLEMSLFVATLVVGLVYIWRKGALDWE